MCVGKGCRQGGSGTPSAWNRVMCELLQRSYDNAEWPTEDPLPWAEGELRQVGVLCWADNFWLLSETLAMAERKASIITMEAQRMGYEFGADSLEVLLNRWVPDRADRRTITDHELREFKVVRKMVVLGVKIDDKGNSDTSVDHRLQEAAKSWGRLRPLLGDTHLSQKERLHKFCQTVQATALHGCGSWSANKKTAVKLQRAEQRALREMLAGRHDKKEDWSSWVQRSCWTVRKAKARWKTQSWAMAWLRRHWSWHGHVARCEHWCPVREALRWRSEWQWRSFQAAARNANRMAPEEGAHPARGGWCKSGEAEIARFCKEERKQTDPWTELALDKARWRNQKTLFAKWLLGRWRMAAA